MGRKKKTLHDYAAEFSDLGVKRHVVEQHNSGERTLVEILYCRSCEITVRVRRDRILEHLASARHYRNKRLAKLWDRKPHLIPSETELQPGSPVELDSTSTLALQPQLILHRNPFTSLPSPAFQPGPPIHSSSISSTSCRQGAASAPGHAAPSTSAGRSHALPPSRLRSPEPTAPASSSSPWLAVPEPSNSAGTRCAFGEGELGAAGVGLALFGVGTGSRALCQSLVEEKGCHLLYIVEEQRWEVETVFSQEHLAHTRVLRAVDTDIVLSDQRVAGILVCSPPKEASKIVLCALRAGKGVFCEKLPSLDRRIAESCFDEAERHGMPLVCGFYKRFDPALQYLYKKVNESDTLGRIQKVAAVSRLYPRPTVARIKASGGIFFSMAVHDIDVICWLLGERIPDTIFSLGHAFCAEVASVDDADSVTVSMKFPSGAIASLDISQHCHKSCDQRLEVHGSEGSLQMENRNPLGVCDRSTSSGLSLQSTADRFLDAYRELLRHFLRTLRGVEPPFITKEQYLWTVQVAAAAEQSWKNGSAVDLRDDSPKIMVIKTEA
ncbi:myo-inositol 2-dehydrogenase-like isoform X1 [Anguilla anguilla]|uniref:myo-inositol 2-dehydrogenase-like isoform X1 n=1 Tax=Anguilla anguilla TaxID=7936 RepID=UPI0015AD645A|nr:myo-inositol 2-dehydrogenase-like isoform X1 [Anguilla anguilla]